MKIGIFDSGLGGLLVAHTVMDALPDYDYMYLGDTARFPYGNRSQEAVYNFAKQAIEYLFAHDCKIIIIGCNTASAEALRKLQQEYLPAHYPDRRILGVLIPAAEEAIKHSATKNIGVLATVSTVKSGAFKREIEKLDPTANVQQQAAPLLAPLVENDGAKWVMPILREYLTPLLAENIDCLVLGCTHYPYFKKEIRECIGNSIALISQDEIIPEKLRDYLERHPEIDHELSRNGKREFLATDITDSLNALGTKLFGETINFTKVELS